MNEGVEMGGEIKNPNFNNTCEYYFAIFDSLPLSTSSLLRVLRRVSYPNFDASRNCIVEEYSARRVIDENRIDFRCENLFHGICIIKLTSS